MMSFLCVALLSCVFVSILGDEEVIINIPHMGKVKGLVEKSETTQRDIYSFRGIPYAEPPIGKRRFQYTVVKKGWGNEVVLDATEFRPACVQPGGASELLWKLTKLNGTNLKGQEDCLFLNVYTPKLPGNGSSELLPVMYFIHGGAFFSGIGAYGGQRLLEKDIVLVVIQYRLGPLGFLTLHTDEIPGNAGLMDQIVGLQWVKNNIKAFGGDPNRVTIFGESAGGASVALLQVSPHAKGLFHGVIAQSGSALCDWAIDIDPIPHTMAFAKLLGCKSNDIKTITKCFQEVDIEKINLVFLIHMMAVQGNGHFQFPLSTPVIQKAGKVKVIDKHPRQYLRDKEYNQVPAIFGTTTDEGSFLFATYYNMFLKPNGYDTNVKYLKEESIPDFMVTHGIYDPTGVVKDSIKNRYFSRARLTNVTTILGGFIDFMGAYMFKAPQYNTAQLTTGQNDIYLYSFDFKGRYSLFDTLFPDIGFNGGVGHAEDLVYLFPIAPELNADEERTAVDIVELWTNFAIYGDPSPENATFVTKWEKYNNETEQYLSINTTTEMKSEYTDIWTAYDDKYGIRENNRNEDEEEQHHHEEAET